MRQFIAVEYRAASAHRPCGHRRRLEHRARPDAIATKRDARAVAVGKAHDQRFALRLERHVETLLAEHADALALELDRAAAAHLPGDAAFALIADVVDECRDTASTCASSPLGSGTANPSLIFLGDEAGGEIAPNASASCCMSEAGRGCCGECRRSRNGRARRPALRWRAARSGAWVTSLAIIGS